MFDSNLDVTQHISPIVDCLDSSLSNYICFEEDKAPTLQGIEFLDKTSKSIVSAVMIDTLPLNMHLSEKNTQDSTLFTNNGNTIIGEDFYHLAKHRWSIKDKYKEEFEEPTNISE